MKTNQKQIRIAQLFHHFDSIIAGKDMFLVAKYLGEKLNAEVKYVYPQKKFNEHFPSVYRGVNLIPIKSNSRYNASVWSEKEMAYWLIKHAREIDVLQLFWLSPRNLFFSKLYKLLNPKGIVYIKGDVNTEPIIPESIKGKIKKSLYSCVDIFSVEIQDIYTKIKNGVSGDHLRKVSVWMPNGVDIDLRQDLNIVRNPYEEKENLIITVGRIGSAQKNNEMLLNAIAKCDLKGWKVALIGPIEDKFNQYISDYFERNPHLKNQVIFTSTIYDKAELWEWYNRAKIFCLTSTFEGMANVLSEALSFGNYILTTPVTGSKEIIANERLGKFVPFNSPSGLACEIQKLVDDDSLLKLTIPEAFHLSDTKLNWRSLVNPIAEKISALIKTKRNEN